MPLARNNGWSRTLSTEDPHRFCAGDLKPEASKSDEGPRNFITFLSQHPASEASLRERGICRNRSFDHDKYVNVVMRRFLP
jgi:hypothetical protein